MATAERCIQTGVGVLSALEEVSSYLAQRISHRILVSTLRTVENEKVDSWEFLVSLDLLELLMVVLPKCVLE
ncbi:hypothetical protein EVAR_49305_1 [Eumeta japonica]|uniref:Uncharacterized protein n=1 Tax=Eumeta variegata TaxID=151549 RepID=A0A4C1XKS8_EUMVA|nr:hypothetical protein EVAR_49305_1 [Eumeta japonica]